LITRRAMLSRRDAMSAAARAAASVAVTERTVALLANRATIALYAPKGSEVDTATIDAALRGRARLVYPRIAESTRLLAFHSSEPRDLLPAPFGLREPPLEPRTQVAIADIDAFVVPGIAFDRAGGRLGWGRGHYDATLAAASSQALRVGIAYECQLVAQVPHAPHDVRLHCVVSELATYWTSP
jgi:5-formyltetrahydrofolate cyclo-ligase